MGRPPSRQVSVSAYGPEARCELRNVEQANLRVLEVMEIKTIPYVPLSHPFVEGLLEPSGEIAWIELILDNRRPGGETARVSEVFQ